MSNLPALIDSYEAGADEPRRAIAGLSRAELMAVPIPGTWSLQQLLVHLYESDLVSVDRMRRLIAMPTPLLMDYDETAFIRELHPELVDAALAAEGFSINRRVMVSVLRAQPLEAFERSGVHSVRGKVSLRMIIEGYVTHLEHHMVFLREKLVKLGRG